MNMHVDKEVLLAVLIAYTAIGCCLVFYAERKQGALLIEHFVFLVAVWPIAVLFLIVDNTGKAIRQASRRWRHK